VDIHDVQTIAMANIEIKTLDGDIVTPGYWYVAIGVKPYYRIVEVRPRKTPSRDALDATAYEFFGPVPAPSMTPVQMARVLHYAEYRTRPKYEPIFDEVVQGWGIHISTPKFSGTMTIEKLEQVMGVQTAADMRDKFDFRLIDRDETELGGERGLIFVDNEFEASRIGIDVIEMLRRTGRY